MKILILVTCLVHLQIHFTISKKVHIGIGHAGKDFLGTNYPRKGQEKFIIRHFYWKPWHVNGGSLDTIERYFEAAKEHNTTIHFIFRKRAATWKKAKVSNVLVKQSGRSPFKYVEVYYMPFEEEISGENHLSTSQDGLLSPSLTTSQDSLSGPSLTTSSEGLLTSSAAFASIPETNILIIGGGPNGLIAALMWLRLNKSIRVTLVEERESYTRSHVLLLAPEHEVNLPDEIRIKLRTPKFRDHLSQLREKPYGPELQFAERVHVNVGHFQTLVYNFIVEQFGEHGEKRLALDPRQYTVEIFERERPKYNMAFITTGDNDFSRNLRRHLPKAKGKLGLVQRLTTARPQPENLTRGVYLTYKAEQWEPYTVALSPLSGLKYFHANDNDNHVQIYTFKTNEPEPAELGNCIMAFPLSFKITASYSSTEALRVKLNGTKNGTEIIEKKFLEEYSAALVQLLAKFNIPFPDKDKWNKISVCYADRETFYYKEVAVLYHQTSVFWIGDGAGAIDYSHGLSTAIGFDATNELLDMFCDKKVTDMVGDFNIYWGVVTENTDYLKDCNLVTVI